VTPLQRWFVEVTGGLFLGLLLSLLLVVAVAAA
jgi:hypothetical protein